MGRPKAALVLTPEEQAALESWSRRTRSARHLALRSRIVLAASQGLDNNLVARKLRVSPQMVCKWRARFLRGRLDSLHDEPRPGAPRKMTDAQVEDVVIRTLESKPAAATHWSVRSMAKATGMNPMTISRIWRAFGLKPHRTETFKLSPDPLLIDKVRDIVGLYMSPPDRAVVLCVDEKSQIQALDRTQPLLPMKPGQVERRTADYKRNGTTSLFAALDIKVGTVLGQMHGRHRSLEFRRFLDLIDDNVPAHLDVHLVLDNYGTHKSPLIRNWLVKRPRYHLHFTPTYGSWLNQVERWFAGLTQKQIRRGAHRSVRELQAAIKEYIAANNADPKPFVWVKTADEILASIARFARRTLIAHGGPTLINEITVTGH